MLKKIQADEPQAKVFWRAPVFLKTLRNFVSIIPVIAGMLLLTGLLLQFLPMQALAALFGSDSVIDAFGGALLGSISAGQPLVSYVLGGELLAGGVSLVAVTALIVSWVTVGSIQLPFEAIMLGKRFAIYRNLLSFVFSVVIAVLTVMTLDLVRALV